MQFIPLTPQATGSPTGTTSSLFFKPCKNAKSRTVSSTGSTNANTHTLKKIIDDVQTIKNTVTNKRSPASGPLTFRDALLRPPPPRDPPKFKEHEIIVILNKAQATGMKTMKESDIIARIQQATVGKNVENVNIRAVNKLRSGDLAIQNNNAEETRRLKENTEWTADVWGNEARTVTKTYPVLVFTYKMRLFKSMDLEAFKAHIKLWNGDMEPVHVTPMQHGKAEDDKGSLILVFRTKTEANAALQKGVVIDARIRTAVVYNRECRIQQCFNCYEYGHISSRCPNETTCGRCSKKHPTPTRNVTSSPCNKDDPAKCAGCGKDHPAWSKNCALRQKEIQRTIVARNNTPAMYRGEDNALSSQAGSSSPMDVDTFMDAEEDLPQKELTGPARRGRSKAITSQGTNAETYPDLTQSEQTPTGCQTRGRKAKTKATGKATASPSRLLVRNRGISPLSRTRSRSPVAYDRTLTEQNCNTKIRGAKVGMVKERFTRSTSNMLDQENQVYETYHRYQAHPPLPVNGGTPKNTQDITAECEKIESIAD